MKELNKCYLIDNKYIIINYTSSKKIKYDNEKKIDRIINDDYFFARGDVAAAEGRGRNLYGK